MLKHTPFATDNADIGTSISADKDIVVTSGTWSEKLGIRTIMMWAEHRHRPAASGQCTSTDYIVHEPSFTGERYGGGPLSLSQVKRHCGAYQRSSRRRRLRCWAVLSPYSDGGSENDRESDAKPVALDHISTSKPVMVYVQGYVHVAKKGATNNGMFVVAPLDPNNRTDGATKQNFGDQLWKLSTNNRPVGRTWFWILVRTDSTTTFSYGSFTYPTLANVFITVISVSRRSTSPSMASIGPYTAIDYT